MPAMVERDLTAWEGLEEEAVSSTDGPRRVTAGSSLRRSQQGKVTAVPGPNGEVPAEESNRDRETNGSQSWVGSRVVDMAGCRRPARALVEMLRTSHTAFEDCGHLNNVLSTGEERILV